MFNNREYEKTYLTGGTTSQIFSGKGLLHGIVVGTTTSTAIAAFDMVQTGSLVPTSTAMILKASIAEGNYSDLDMNFANGLYITYGTAGTYTVIWSKP